MAEKMKEGDGEIYEIWDNDYFHSEEEKRLAAKILMPLEGMRIDVAIDFLNRCRDSLMFTKISYKAASQRERPVKMTEKGFSRLIQRYSESRQRLKF